jgi:murein DD-endopeptidase MepM/ murein hydrolase activator NlpD
MKRFDRAPRLAATVGTAAVVLSLAPVVKPLPAVDPARPPEPPPLEIVHDTLRHGMALADLMAANGLDGRAIHEITEVIREYKKPRTLLPGAVMNFSRPPGDAPIRVNLQFNPDTTLRLIRSDSSWNARLDVVPLVVDTVRLTGVIETSLWNATLGGDAARIVPDGFQEMVYDLADVFAWKVDFTRDIQKGDAFRVVYEREVRPDGSVRSRRFLAVELRNRDRVWQAIPYPRERGRIAYFDPKGGSLRGAFIRYPVPYRITSGFKGRRFHPILKRVRAHRGIDYGAPTATRVQATASGTVTRAGWWSGYGRVVEIRHLKGIRTRYAHLSSIASGIRPGARVAQGQMIGRVGATGLASGPHLHYEFLQNGVHRNPMTVTLPTEPGLEKEHMEDFRRVRDAALALLEPLPAPGPPQLAATASPR